ncbi:type II secretion system F family protein [Glaciecola siphonariae]|uniref:Type II secretion system F family protein n=1 Tax=Glaciecola siphonariae TaxID=521012 RepID=A0ABV9LYV5_9ALTE
MASFIYTGRTLQGEVTTGSVDSADEQSAAQTLRARSITPIEIKPKQASAPEQKVAAKPERVGILTPQVAIDDLVIFCRQMYSLTKAGIPIIRAVTGLAGTRSLRLKLALYDVIEQLEKGRNLSSAMSQHPKIFSQLFVSIVHVGENTGQLDSAFLQLAHYLEREQETRKQVKAATRYPSFVVFALVAALIVMNIFVIPVFAGMFEKFDTELPLMTRILLGMSDFFINQWYVLIGFILVCFFITKHYKNTQRGRLRWDYWKLKMPIVGDIVERSLLARFSRSFSMMLKAGVPLTSALSLVADAVSNAHMNDAIVNMRRRIEKGESLGRVSSASGLFTPLVLQMIHVGEETGRVDDLLAEVAEFYEREVEYDIKSLTSKIEPILISIVAVMVLVLALGIFTPMWDMMGVVS